MCTLATLFSAVVTLILIAMHSVGIILYYSASVLYNDGLHIHHLLPESNIVQTIPQGQIYGII